MTGAFEKGDDGAMKTRGRTMAMFAGFGAAVTVALLVLSCAGAEEGRLKGALAGIDRLRIRSGGTCHRRIDEEKTLAEVTDPAEIRGFIEGIELKKHWLIGLTTVCMCCGDPSFEFYRGGKLAVTVSFHHGKRLRWREGWDGDADLTQRSADLLVQWLARRGVTGPRDEREEGH